MRDRKHCCIHMPNTELVSAHDGGRVPYTVVSNFNATLVVQAESDWAQAKAKIITEIISKNPECITDEKLFTDLIIKNNLEDLNWNWLRKALHCNTNEYHWFFLTAAQKIQAICIIYHPKESRIDSQNIFYVDYLATAFWNRDRPGYTRQYSGLGTILLAHSIQFAIDKLKYRPGFCLHSLPNAEKFYARLGMRDFGHDVEKENLKFFEAEEAAALSIVKEANV